MTVRITLCFLVASVLLAVGCGKINQVDPPPPYVGPEARTIEFTSAEAVYYGDDGATEESDMWNVRLSGNGEMLQISFNTVLAKEADADYLEGFYTARPEDEDYSPDTFNQGCMFSIEISDEVIEGPAMSYYVEYSQDGDDSVIDLLREGYVTVDINSDATFTIEGTMVGEMFLKRNFTYTGNLEVIDLTKVSSETKSSNDCRYEINYEIPSDIMRFDLGVYKAGECFRK